MSVRFFVLLFAACLFGLGALLGIRRRPAGEATGGRPQNGKVQPSTRVALSVHTKVPDPAAPPRTAIEPARASGWEISYGRLSRIGVLLLTAAGLGSAAYFGLGGGSSPHPPALTARYAFAAAEEAAHIEMQAETRSLKQDLLSSVRIPASPPAAPIAEETPAPPPEAPAPEPTPAVAAVSETPVPQPTPEPPPPYTDGLEAMICAMPWPCWEAIAVAACESGRDMSGRLDGAWATNGNHYGLFQISGIHAYRFPGFYENWMDPQFNINMAYTIWAEQGWWPWSCRPY